MKGADSADCVVRERG